MCTTIEPETWISSGSSGSDGLSEDELSEDELSDDELSDEGSGTELGGAGGIGSELELDDDDDDELLELLELLESEGFGLFVEVDSEGFS